MNRLLICKDAEQNTLLEARPLIETDNITYTIIENAPIIEERENQIGRYALDEQGQVIVVYDEKPKTQLDLIQEQLNQLLQSTASISSDNLLNMDLIMGTDEKVDENNTKLDAVKGE